MLRAQAAGSMGMNPALAQKLSGEQAGAMTAQTQRDVGQVGLQEQMQAQQALQQWLQQQRQAQMQLEMAKAGQHGMQQQMLANQAAGDQGMFGSLMNVGGQLGAAALTGGMSGAGSALGSAFGNQGGPVAGQTNQYGYAGTPQWSDYGF